MSLEVSLALAHKKKSSSVLVSHPQDPVSPPQDLVSHPQGLVSHHQDLVSHPQDLMSHPQDLVSHPQDLVSHPQDLVSPFCPDVGSSRASESPRVLRLNLPPVAPVATRGKLPVRTPQVPGGKTNMVWAACASPSM